MDDLSVIVRYSRMFSERKLKKFNIGFPEQVILMYLSKKSDVNQDTIATHFLIDKGSIAKTCSKLEKKSMITRKQNPLNKREYLISLSPEGRELIGYMKKILLEWNECIYKDISNDEIKNMKKLTGVIAQNAANAINEDGGVLDEKE